MSKEEVIILHPDLGKVFEESTFKKGFIYNYLLPKGLVLLKNKKNEERIKRIKLIQEKKEALAEAAAQKIYDKLHNLVIEFELTKDKSGNPFGSISFKEILQKLEELQFDIQKNQLVNFTPISELGENTVEIKLSNKITAKIKLIVK
jgi:large subunit ribosomal protein L9